MICGHRVDGTTTYYYDSNQPSWDDTNYEWDGYYQQYTKVRLNIAAYTVGAVTGSYFKNTTNTLQQIYISSTVNAAEMYASNPNEKSETH